MAVYRFAGEIGEDHRVEFPQEIPAGPVQIVVIPQVADTSRQERFQQLVHKMASGPFHTRTRQDIDAELRHERESWE